MLNCNYNSVIQHLSSAGYLNSEYFLNSDSLLRLNEAELVRAGIPCKPEVELFIVKTGDKFELYELENIEKNLLGYGDEGRVLLGKNLETNESVAIKYGVGMKSGLAGWILARDRLNQCPQFVKTHACGVVNDLHDKKFPLGKETVHIMECVQGGKTLIDISYLNWSANQIINFFEKSLDAADCMHQEGIHGYDYDTPKNILVDENGLPKFCDFNGLTIGSLSKHFFYLDTIRFLHQVYTGYKYAYLENQSKHPSSQSIYTAIEDCANFIIEQNHAITREAISAKLKQTIYECEKHKCILDCINKDSNEYYIKLSTAHQRALPCTSTCSIISDLQLNESYESIIQKGQDYSTSATFVLPSECLNLEKPNVLQRSPLSMMALENSLSSSSQLLAAGVALCVLYKNAKSLMNWGASLFGKRSHSVQNQLAAEQNLDHQAMKIAK